MFVYLPKLNKTSLLFGYNFSPSSIKLVDSYKMEFIKEPFFNGSDNFGICQ